MSLDVYLTLRDKTDATRAGSGIFIRENGSTREVTRAEFEARFPDCEPVALLQNDADDGEVFSANITHNLVPMAEEAGLYEVLWRPDEIHISTAAQLIGSLACGLHILESNPSRFKALNPPNGWGDYDGFLSFVRRYLEACEESPDAIVRVSR